MKLFGIALSIFVYIMCIAIRLLNSVSRGVGALQSPIIIIIDKIADVS